MSDREEQIIREALGEQRRERFDDGFVNRATARWRDDRSTSAMMSRQFRRLSTIAAAAVLVLAIYNIRHRRADEGQSIGAALLGITPRVSPAMTIDEIYGLGALSGGG